MLSDYEAYLAGLSAFSRGGIGIGIILASFLNFLVLLFVLSARPIGNASDSHQGIAKLGSVFSLCVVLIASIALAGAGALHAYAEFRLAGFSKSMTFTGLVPVCMASMALWIVAGEALGTWRSR